MADRPLTVKQERFVQGLFAGMSQREAYREAYSSSREWTDNTVDVKACLLAKNDKVMIRLEALQNEFKERNMITAEYVLNSIKNVAERCMQAEPVMIRDGRDWIGSGEYKFDSSGANKALELLGKHLKLFTEKH